MKKVLAIDLGGTKINGAIIDENGNMLIKKRIPTNSQLGPECLLNSFFTIIEELKSESDIDCICIGSAGRINMDTGDVYYASDNIPGWTGVRLRSIIEERFGIMTVVENDCKVAGLGEDWMGAAQNTSSSVCLALGTGVGAAVKINNKLVHGKHWSAGELGHMTLYPNGRQCNCGLKGCLEQYCSGTALVKRYNHLSVKNKVETGYELFELISKNDELSLIVLNEFVGDLATAIVSLANIYDPEMFIVGGGLIDTKEYWWDSLIERVNESSLSTIFTPKVVAAKLGNDAALYGAAYIGLEKLKGIDV